MSDHCGQSVGKGKVTVTANERAVLRQEALRLMGDGWILVDAGSWFWLMNGNQQPLRVNNNSAKSIIRPNAHSLRRRLLQMWTIGETEVRP